MTQAAGTCCCGVTAKQSRSMISSGSSLTTHRPFAQLLEQHWVKVVEPVVEVQPQELVSCSHGLRALVDAVEARVLGDLQTGIAAVFVQARAFHSSAKHLNGPAARRRQRCHECRSCLKQQAASWMSQSPAASRRVKYHTTHELLRTKCGTLTAVCDGGNLAPHACDAMLLVSAG